VGREAVLHAPRHRFVQGRTHQEIAAECFLSVNSIKTYIRSAYRKIGITHRAQAVAWGMQNGFPPPT